MPIAAVSQAAVARAGAASPVSEVTRVDDAGAARQRPQERRRELVDAMMETLAVERSSLDRRSEQAVYRFAHALMHDLRAVGGGDHEEALGRRDWADVGSRLAALVAAAASSSRADADAVPESVPEALPLPSPVTVTSAAVHLMRVPSSRLVEAFVALRDAVPSLAEVSSGNGDDRSQLAAFLQRLVEAEPQAATPSGVLLHTRA